MVERGFPAHRVHNLGDDVHPTLDELLDAIATLLPGREGVLIGMVNIHTHQAELLLDHFAELDGDAAVDELEQARDPLRAPAPMARLYRTASRPGVPVMSRRRDR